MARQWYWQDGAGRLGMAATLIALLAACTVTAGQPVDRVVQDSSRTARYQYLDRWSFVEGEERNNLWVDAYSRSLRDNLSREISCQVAYQVRGAPASEESFVNVFRTVAEKVAESAEAEGLEIKASHDVVGDRKVIRLSAAFEVTGSHVTTFDSGTVISKPVTFDWGIEGTILTLKEDRVLAFCVNSDRDRVLARKFIDTVNASFEFELII